jgi:hypothetical protein
MVLFFFLEMEQEPTILFHIEFHICLHGCVFRLFRNGMGYRHDFVPLMEHRHETGLLVLVGPLLVAHFMSVETEMGSPSVNAIAFRK